MITPQFVLLVLRQTSPPLFFGTDSSNYPFFSVGSSNFLLFSGIPKTFFTFEISSSCRFIFRICSSNYLVLRICSSNHFFRRFFKLFSYHFFFKFSYLLNGLVFRTFSTNDLAFKICPSFFLDQKASVASLDCYRASVDHGMTYIFRKL